MTKRKKGGGCSSGWALVSSSALGRHPVLDEAAALSWPFNFSFWKKFKNLLFKVTLYQGQVTPPFPH